MKKTVMTVLAATLACGVCAMGVFADGHGYGASAGRNTASAVCRYVDADGDGLCDTCGTAHACWNDADGDGLCDTCGTAHACWNDADGDGVCDTCGTAHACRNDTDGDGLCDTWDTGCTGSTGAHHGYGHGRGHGCTQ